ncbi:MAG: ATP synthase F0 subunit C [Desulfatibacillaceae bacterium]|nr:ATP synthase F0 subunit C [Desulfatibacillaceae bacterium]
MMEWEPQIWVRAAAFFGGGLCIGLGAIGAAIGEGYTASVANESMARNPSQSNVVLKDMLVGQAVAESAAIFALVVAMILLFSSFSNPSWLTAAAIIGAALSMGFGAIGAGIGSGFPAGEACRGTVRQPAVANKLMTNMLIGAAVCQTPSIFALVVSFILLYTDFSAMPVWPAWAALVGAGLATGLAAIGSGLGGGTTAQASVEGIARRPESASSVTVVMLLGQAVVQSPAIFGLLISFILLFGTYEANSSLAPAMALLSAGLCVGFGAIGPAIGGGEVGRNGVRWVARNPGAGQVITRIMLVGMAVSQSTVIYAMVISLVLIYVV